MDFEKLIDNITPEIYQSLRRAVEIGKWPDGRALTDDQREHCMSAVIAWDLRFQSEENRVGFIDRGTKKEGEVCGDDHDHDHSQDETPIRWAD